MANNNFEKAMVWDQFKLGYNYSMKSRQVPNNVINLQLTS